MSEKAWSVQGSLFWASPSAKREEVKTILVVSSPEGGFTLGGVGVVGLHVEVFLVVDVGFVELFLEAAHLGEVEVELALAVVVFLVGEALVDAFGAGVVVGEAVALGNLEVDAVLLGLVVLDFLVGSLVFLAGFDVAVLVEKIVGFLGDLCVGAGACKQCGEENQQTFFQRFHI